MSISLTKFRIPHHFLFFIQLCTQLIDGEAIDIGGVKWSPDGTKIAIWDGSHSGKLGIYLISGSKLADLTDVFGIHSIEWSPTAQVLAVATVGCKVQTLFCCFVLSRMFAKQKLCFNNR